MISIITPVYNGIKHIENCINSVIAQDCSDVEHLIMDGGSDDGTVDIIKIYSKRYSHISWMSEKDEGQVDAMNKSIGMAKGEILCYLNVDDYFEPGTIKRVASLFATLPNPSLLVGNCNVWYSEGELGYVNKPSRLRLLDLLMKWEVNQLPNNPSSYFYHKSLHDIIGLYDKKDRFSFDADFIFRAVQASNVKYVDETFGNYRLYPGTITYEDHKNGLQKARLPKLRKKYIKNLPYLKRLKLYLLKLYYYTLLWILKITGYSWIGVHDFPAILKKKLNAFVNEIIAKKAINLYKSIMKG